MDTKWCHLAPLTSSGAVGCDPVTGKWTPGLSSPDHMAYRSITSRGQTSDGRLIIRTDLERKGSESLLIAGSVAGFRSLLILSLSQSSNSEFNC